MLLLPCRVQQTGYCHDYGQRFPSCAQVLHYNVDSMQEKLQYLKEIGMGKQQVAHSISRLPQLLALDVRHNMRPKYNYLQSQMGGDVQTLCSYPAFFSLSLPQRYARLCSQVYICMQCSMRMGPGHNRLSTMQAVLTMSDVHLHVLALPCSVIARHEEESIDESVVGMQDHPSA